MIIDHINIALLSYLSWVAGAFIGAATFFAQIASTNEGWLPLLVQAGMSAVVAILLLRSFPALMKANADQSREFLNALETQRKVHTEHLETITREIEKKHDAQLARILSTYELDKDHWNEMLRTRGWCPVRDGGKDQRDEK